MRTIWTWDRCVELELIRLRRNLNLCSFESPVIIKDSIFDKALKGSGTETLGHRRLDRDTGTETNEGKTRL